MNSHQETTFDYILSFMGCMQLGSCIAAVCGFLGWLMFDFSFLTIFIIVEIICLVIIIYIMWTNKINDSKLNK